MGTEDRLMEEWKQNVALYIDQDKRGMERTRIFLAIHAGLLTFFTLLWKNLPSEWHLPVSSILIVLGFSLTIISQRMAKRAHAFILLRKIQGMLIEKKIKEGLQTSFA